MRFIFLLIALSLMSSSCTTIAEKWAFTFAKPQSLAETAARSETAPETLAETAAVSETATETLAETTNETMSEAAAEPLSELVYKTLSEIALETMSETIQKDSFPVEEAGRELASSLEPDENSLPPVNLWDLIEADYKFAPRLYHNRRVKAQIDFLMARKDLLLSINDRAHPFLYYIYEEIDKRGLPMELALLPAVESTYDPYAYSPAGASGLWQFTRSTGKAYGLIDGWWYSERRDLEASTQAALDHLEDLYDYYDNWELALAAYNAGPRRVNRAIAYNRKYKRPTDYWHLRLPRETQKYVPRLIAYSHLFSRPHRAQLGITPIDAISYWTKVASPHQLSFAELIETADLDEEEFFLLNAAHNQWLSPPSQGSLLIPVDDEEKVKEVIANMEFGDETRWLSYQVQHQEEVTDIADRFGITRDDIAELNDIKKLAAGQYIILPLDRDNQNIDFSQLEAGPPQYVERQYSHLYHRVRRGDTLWGLSRAYGVSIQQLQQWNRLKSSRLIYPGQNLIVAQRFSAAEPAVYLAADYNRKVMRSVYYRVRRGDSLHSIAAKFNTSPSDLAKWNASRARAKYIYPGQSIKLYLDVTDL